MWTQDNLRLVTAGLSGYQIIRIIQDTDRTLPFRYQLVTCIGQARRISLMVSALYMSLNTRHMLTDGAALQEYRIRNILCDHLDLMLHFPGKYVDEVAYHVYYTMLLAPELGVQGSGVQRAQQELRNTEVARREAFAQMQARQADKTYKYQRLTAYIAGLQDAQRQVQVERVTKLNKGLASENSTRIRRMRLSTVEEEENMSQDDAAEVSYESGESVEGSKEMSNTTGETSADVTMDIDMVK